MSRVSADTSKLDTLRGHLEKECALDVDWAYDDMDPRDCSAIGSGL